MKKIISSLLVSVLLVSLLVSTTFAADKTEQTKLEILGTIQKPTLNAQVKNPNGTNAEEIRYVLENIYTNSIIVSKTSTNGKIQININPSMIELEALRSHPTKNLNIQHLDYALRVFDNNGHMANYYFSLPFIKDISKVSAEKIENLKYLHSAMKMDREFTLELKPVEIRSTDEHSVSPQAYCITQDQYDLPTDIGFVNGVPGMTNTFTYKLGSSVKIDVMTKYAGGWETGGSLTQDSTYNGDHILQNLTYPEGRMAREKFTYERRDCVDEVTGSYWEEIISLYHIGPWTWGTTYIPGNNGKNSDDVLNELYGHFYTVDSDHTPNFYSANGTRFSFAAGYPVSGSNVWIGLSTAYYAETGYKPRSADGRHYLMYDMDKSNKLYYATLWY